MATLNPEKRLFSIAEVTEILSVGRTTVYILLTEGKLEKKKLGSKTLVTATSIENFINSLPSTNNYGAHHEK